MNPGQRETVGTATSTVVCDGDEIMSWPEQCDGEATDCGKAAVQELLGPLVSATCVGR